MVWNKILMQWGHPDSLIWYFLAPWSSSEPAVVLVRHLRSKPFISAPMSEEGSLRSHELGYKREPLWKSFIDRHIGYQLLIGCCSWSGLSDASKQHSSFIEERRQMTNNFLRVYPAGISWHVRGEGRLVSLVSSLLFWLPCFSLWHKEKSKWGECGYDLRKLGCTQWGGANFFRLKVRCFHFVHTCVFKNS